MTQQAKRKPKYQPKGVSEKITHQDSIIEDSDSSGTECLTCCEPISLFCISDSCSHKHICGFCSFRLRRNYNNFNCIICKAEQRTVVYTTHDCNFEDLNLEHLKNQHNVPEIGVIFENEEVYQLIYCNLLQLTCAICKANDFPSIQKLQSHLKNTHRKYFCTVCLEHSKKFVKELKVYSYDELQKHTKGVGRVNNTSSSGYLSSSSLFTRSRSNNNNNSARNNNNSNNNNNSGSNNSNSNSSSNNSSNSSASPSSGEEDGHPMCTFCKLGFYNDDELWLHMEHNHYSCMICSPVGELVYYKVYAQLEDHYTSLHYYCMDAACRSKTHIVFANKFDLQAHTVSEHASKMSKSQIKKAATIDLSFNYRSTPSTPPSSSGSGGGGGRNNANQNNNNNNNNNNNASNGGGDNSSSSGSDYYQQQITLDINPPSTTDELRERNKKLVERLKGILGQSSYAEFQSTSKSYANTSISAHQYHTFFISTVLSKLSPSSATPITSPSMPNLNAPLSSSPSLSSHSVEDLAKVCDILCELISLLPDKSKRDDLIAAHLLWKQKRYSFGIEDNNNNQKDEKEEEFPSLPSRNNAAAPRYVSNIYLEKSGGKSLDDNSFPALPPPSKPSHSTPNLNKSNNKKKRKNQKEVLFRCG